MPNTHVSRPSAAGLVAAPWGSLPALARLNLAVLGVCFLGLVWLLWPLWRGDPDLSHGFAVPILFVILAAESRLGGDPRFLPRNHVTAAAGAAALALGFLCAGSAGLYGSALGPTHAMTCFFGSTGLALLLLAAWVALADENVRIISFGWPAVVALVLLPLSSPLPPGSYARLSIALQGWVTAAVTGTLGLFGIAAYQDGNVIVLAHASVGVTEACSGVRSLVSCVAAGLFLSAVLLRRPLARAALVVLAPLLALLMNYFRSLILTLIANARGDIGSGWHFGTGLAITGVTTALLAWAAVALRGRGKREGPPPAAAAALRRPRNQGALALALGLLAVLLVVLALARRPFGPPGAGAPDLEALFSQAPEGWQVSEGGDLGQFSAVLQTPYLIRRTYASRDVRGPVFVSIYAAYWLPNQASASLVSIHTPDLCWAGSGFSAEPLRATRSALPVDGRTLPPAECRLFSKEGSFTRVWFWHLFAGRLLIQESPFSVQGLLRLALSYDLRRGGDQLFVVVSSNRPWDDVASNPALREFFARTAPMGL